MTQMQSHRNPKIPADIFPPGKTEAVFARRPTKMRANAASVHVTPSTKGPLPPYAETIDANDSMIFCGCSNPLL